MTKKRIKMTEELGQTMAEYAFVLRCDRHRHRRRLCCPVRCDCVVDRQRGHHRQECVSSAKTASPGQFRGRRLTQRRTRKRHDRSETCSNDRGQTMVEFALVVPILCLVLFGILQFGMLYNDYVTLTDATRVGARKGAVSRTAVNPVARRRRQPATQRRASRRRSSASP